MRRRLAVFCFVAFVAKCIAQNLMDLTPSLPASVRERRAADTTAVARPSAVDNSTYSNASFLLLTLLDGYDIRLRPGFGGDALVLEMDIVVASFDSVSEVNMDYTVTMYLHQYWKDERLAFGTGGERDTTNSMTLSGDFAKSIWVPDTFLANDKNSFLHDVTETNKMLRLYSDGYIAYGMRFTSTLACHMNLRHYPLDSQKYGYTQSEVSMMWREGFASVRGVQDAEIPQFTIVKYNTANRSVTTSTGKYQRLSLEFYLRRSIGYFIFQTYLPCILIVMLSWVSFWINHEATSARVALGITTVLTMTTISTGVRQSLPRISYVKSIDIYLVMCFVFVFAALLEYAAVNYSYWGMKSKKKRMGGGTGEMTMPGGEDGGPEFDCGGGDGDDTEGRVEFPMLPDAYNPANEPRMLPSIAMLEPPAISSKRASIVSRAGRPSSVRFSEGDDERPTTSTATAVEKETTEEEDEYDNDSSDHVAIRRSLIKGQAAAVITTCETSLVIAKTSSKNELNNGAQDSRLDDPRTDHSPARRYPPPPLATSMSSGRMSPIPSLYQQAQQMQPSPTANSTHASTHSICKFDIDEFPDYPRMSTPGYQPPPSRTSRNSTGLRHRAGTTGRLKRSANRRKALTQTFNNVRRRARSIVPRIRDINVIDKYSRVFFPSCFIIFNLVYWVYYAILAEKITDDNAE